MKSTFVFLVVSARALLWAQSSPFATWLPPADGPAKGVLVLENIRPITEDAKGHLHLSLDFGNEAPNAQAAADYNEQSANTVGWEDWKRDGDRITARAKIQIGPDGARRGRAHFPTPNDMFDLRIEAELGRDVWFVPPPDREAFMPSWRKDTPRAGGKAITGRYEGTWAWKGQTNQVSGEISGAWSQVPQAGTFGAVGPAWVAAAPRDELLLMAFLPAEPAVVGDEAWAEVRIDPPGALPSHGALRVTARAAGEQSAAHASLMIQTERGWFSARDVLPLAATNRIAEVGFARLGSRWRPFAGTELRALRVGVRNGLGVGTVGMLVSDLSIHARPGSVAPGPVRVVLRPEVARVFNGAREVPKGLFGFHDVGENDPKPQPGQADPIDYIRELHPGMLRPLTHTGFGGKALTDEQVAERMDLEKRSKEKPTSAFFRRAEAGNSVDNVVWTHTMDLWARPSWMDKGIETAASDVEVFYRNEAASAWIPGDDHNVKRRFEVWNEPFMWGRGINMGFRNPPGAKAWTDPTQFGYLPGELGARAWSEIFAAAVRGAKSANPHVLLGGPSAPSFNTSDYRDFKNYMARIFDAVGDRLDFITEHHYGGNPLAEAAGYEVTRAYLWNKHGRVVPIINTEANDLGASDAGKATYNLADILNMIVVCPDIAQGRALHASWNGYLRSSGEEHAYRLAAPLRGILLEVLRNQERLTVVASHPTNGVAVVVGVDHGVGVAEIEFPVPPGFAVEELVMLLADAPAAELNLRDVDGAFVPKPAAGKTEWAKVKPDIREGNLRFSLPERSAFRVILTRKDYRPAREHRTRQVILPHVLEEIGAGSSLPLSTDGLGDPDRIFLRLVHARAGEGELTLRVGDKSVPLPAGAFAPGDAEVIDVEVPVDLIGKSPRMEVGQGDGVMLLALSWLVEE